MAHSKEAVTAYLISQRDGMLKRNPDADGSYFDAAIEMIQGEKKPAPSKTKKAKK